MDTKILLKYILQSTSKIKINTPHMKANPFPNITKIYPELLKHQQKENDRKNELI